MNINQLDYKDIPLYPLLYFSYFDPYINMPDGWDIPMVANEFKTVLDKIRTIPNFVNDADKQKIQSVINILNDEISYNNNINILFKDKTVSFPVEIVDLTIKDIPTKYEHVNLPNYETLPDPSKVNGCWAKMIESPGKYHYYFAAHSTNSESCFGLLMYKLLIEYHEDIKKKFEKKNENKDEGLLFSGFDGSYGGHAVLVYYYKIQNSTDYLVIIFNSGIGIENKHDYINGKYSSAYFRIV
jgi:hypothetical protein